jgi:hypothetical protein
MPRRDTVEASLQRDAHFRTPILAKVLSGGWGYDTRQQQGEHLFLLLLLAVRLSGYSGDRSRKLPRIGKKDRVVKGVGQHRQVRLGQRKIPGRILETAGSTSDLKGKSTVCHQSREIYAIASLREIDLQ